MERDARRFRGERPFIFTNCMTGDGLEQVMEHIERAMHEYAI
jgi:urease accessory protein